MTTIMHGLLRIPVRDGLVLDAGSWKTASYEGDTVRVITPPDVPLIDQLITYLEAQPPLIHSHSSQMAAVGIAALSLRWGSYYAVLADTSKPLWPGHRNPEVGRIGDGEMMRINIEGSFALSRLIEIYRHDSPRFWRLMNLAVNYLPVSRQRARLDRDAPARIYFGLARPKGREGMKKSVTPARLEREMEGVRHAPERVIANSFLHGCWRNGPCESVHGSPGAGSLPLEQARISRREDARLFALLSDNLSHAFRGLTELAEHAKTPEDWARAALPYSLLRLDHGWWIFGASESWSLTATSCPVTAFGPEPSR